MFALGSNQELGAIDDIGRALSLIWEEKNGKDTKQLKIKKKEIQKEILTKEEKKKLIDEINSEIESIESYNEKLNNPYSLKIIAQIKKEYKSNPEKCKKDHSDLFYYFDGLNGVYISQSVHPAGVIVSPITLYDNYGIMINDGKHVLQLDMDAAHEINLVKYDILKLKSVKVLKTICDYLNIPYPRSYEVDWNDEEVWNAISENNIAIPQFESDFSGQLIRTMKPRNIVELAIINAAIRPAGSSYRDNLTHRIKNVTSNHNVDALFKDSLGYCVFQEDIMQFLQKFCGFSGSASDNIRRAIGMFVPFILETI